LLNMTGSKYGSININNNKEPKKGEYTDREVPSRLQEDDEDQGWAQPGHSKLAGVCLALVSGALFTANNFLINQLHVSVPDLLLVRTGLQMTVNTCICWYRYLPVLPGDAPQKVFILLQGLMSALTLVTALAAVSYMPVPDALSIVFSCPLVTILLSALVLRDRLGLTKISAGLLLLLGVILVCKPPFLFHEDGAQHADYPLYYLGLVLAMAGCVSGGAMNVLVARCRAVPSPVLVNVSAAAGLLLATLYCLLDPGSQLLGPRILTTTWAQWATFAGLSVSGLAAFTTLTKSLQLVSPNLVASLRCVELVAAFAVQSLLTSTAPSLVASTGAALIILGVLLLAFQPQLDHCRCVLIKRVSEATVRVTLTSEMDTARLISVN